MAIEDLYAIAVISLLLVFSVGVTLLARRRKPLYGPGKNPRPESRSAGTTEAGQDGTQGVGTLELDVRFSESGRHHPWDSREESLLSFAESLGIEVNSQCRAGECGSCRTRLLSGDVEYLTEPKIHPGSGHCLLCICVPRTHLTLER